MIRRLISATLLLMLLVCVVMPLRAEDPGVIILVEGKQESFDRPLLLRGQVLIWIRDFERLGWGKVNIADDGEIVLEREGLSISFFPGRKTALINKLAVEMPFAPLKISDRLLVPLHFTARALGYSCSTAQAVVVDIKQLPKASAPASPDAVAAQGRITGRILYNSKAVPGVKLRLVGEDEKFLPGISAVSDQSGRYEFRQLPAGTYRVYSYIGDNPDYFNRWTDWVRLDKNAGAEADDLVLGRVVVPVSPRIGEKLVLREGKGTFSWSACPGAAKYELSIVDPASGRVLLSHETKTASANLRLELRQGRTYQWRIQALDAGGDYLGGSPGKGGEAWTFQL
jgi:hypothetical protein